MCCVVSRKNYYKTSLLPGAVLVPHHMTSSPRPIQVTAPTKLHYCPRCHPAASLGQPNHVPGNHPMYSWALDLVCPTCRCLFTLCTTCSTQRTHYTTNRMLQRHHRLCLIATAMNCPPTQLLASSTSSISDLNTENSSLQLRPANINLLLLNCRTNFPCSRLRLAQVISNII